MDPRTKSSLLWGLVGGLSLLVLAQGYRLVVPDARLSLPLVAGAALAVTLAAAAGSYLLEGRFAGGKGRA